MDKEVVNTEIREFLKKADITLQQEIERALQAAIESGRPWTRQSNEQVLHPPSSR